MVEGAADSPLPRGAFLCADDGREAVLTSPFAAPDGQTRLMLVLRADASDAGTPAVLVGVAPEPATWAALSGEERTLRSVPLVPDQARRLAGELLVVAARAEADAGVRGRSRVRSFSLTVPWPGRRRALVGAGALLLAGLWWWFVLFPAAAGSGLGPDLAVLVAAIGAAAATVGFLLAGLRLLARRGRGERR